MGIEENKFVVKRAFDALASGDLAPLSDLLTPDAVWHQCGFLHPLRLRTIIEEGALVGPLAPRIIDRRVTLERMIGEGDLVAVHWRTAGRFNEPDSPEDHGKPVDFPTMTFVRLENGLIAEIWNIQDGWTLRTQLSEPREPVASR